MTDALEHHEGIGGKTVTNLRFADDIDGLAGVEEELVKLVERLDKASTANFAKCQRAVENRELWRKLVAKSSVVPQRPL